jgi:flagellar protein FlbT
MSQGFQIRLRPGERLYINGAVLRPDRKVSIEFLNDVTFLLESHVMQPEDTTTPLRQLYFIVQMMLIEPKQAEAAREMFEKSHALLLASFENREVRDALEAVHRLVCGGRMFEALKTIRGLFRLEDVILGRLDSPPMKSSGAIQCR